MITIESQCDACGHEKAASLELSGNCQVSSLGFVVREEGWHIRHIGHKDYFLLCGACHTKYEEAEEIWKEEFQAKQRKWLNAQRTG